MINRLVYKTDSENKESILKCLKANPINEKVYALNLFEFLDTLYLYYECDDCELTPDEIMPECAEWVRIYDIFHYSRPIDTEGWRRKCETQPYAKMARLRPEMLSSYIFYHYQYQEENPGDGNKYGAIYLDGNVMFFYLENPDIVEPVQYNGLLETDNTPSDWGGLMSKHFLYWEGSDEPWRNDVELIFSYFA